MTSAILVVAGVIGAGSVPRTQGKGQEEDRGEGNRIPSFVSSNTGFYIFESDFIYLKYLQKTSDDGKKRETGGLPQEVRLGGVGRADDQGGRGPVH